MPETAIGVCILRSFTFLPLLFFGQAGHAAGAASTDTANAAESGLSAEAEEEETIGVRRGEILVIGSRLIGTIDAAQPPLVTLDEADIASYGASSLTELLAAVAPQTGTGRGRGGGHPVILMNGLRISNFREMRGFSPEAVRRMEVLPEEVALRYGFPPNQRVINFILKDSFSSRTIDGEYNVPTRGGFADSEATFSLLRIKGPSRLNLNAYLEDTSLLTEAERGIVQPAGSAPRVAGDPDPALYRSLIADSRDFGFNGSWSTGLGDKGMAGSLSANASFARNDRRALSGVESFVLAGPVDPLERISRTDRIEGGAALNKRLGSWQLTLTLDGGHIVTDTATDRPAGVTPAGIDRARVASDSLTSLLTMAGGIFRLPAGDVATTFKAGFAHTAITSSDSRQVSGPTRLKRGDASAGINLALPITSRRESSGAKLGDITLNFSAGLNHLSDFGTLSDWSAGVTWGVTEKLSLQASYIVNEAPPSLGDLGNPAIVSLNVPVYDFARGENAIVAVTNGGNRTLRSERQRDVKFSANWQLPISGANLVAEYFRNSSNDVTAAFPLLTPAMEAAFPGRATRDASGRLVAIDSRPVTFFETRGERLRWGINLSGSIGKAPAGRGGGPPGQMGRPRGGPGGPAGGPQAGGPRGPGGGGPGAGGSGMGRMMAMMGGGGGQGRWSLSVYHTVRFADEVTIGRGGPVLDLLGGDALSGGGVARHSLELEGGAYRKGFGMRVKGNWSAPTRIEASGAPGTSDLRFGSVFRLDIRIFSDFGRQKALTDISPVFKGMRLAFQFDNVFDSRRKVTDASGATPFSYLPDFLDPRGRVIGIDLRKSF